MYSCTACGILQSILVKYTSKGSRHTGMRKHSLVELTKFHNARNIHAQLDGVNEVISAHIKLWIQDSQTCLHEAT